MTNLDSFQTVKREDSLRPQIFVCGNEATNLLLENGFSREGAWGGGGGCGEEAGLITAQNAQFGRPNSPLGFIYHPNYTLQEEQLLINPVTN